MNSQLELKPFEAAPDDVNVRWLEDLLDGAKCWMSAKDICLTTQGKVLDREVRVLANASAKIISGQKGYRHAKHSSPEEIAHFAHWMRSQAKTMDERVGRVLSYAHSVFGKALTTDERR